MHHQHSDKIYDPHCPYVDGKFNIIQSIKVFFGYDWQIPNIPVNYVKDLMRDKTHKIIFNNYFKIIFAGVFVLFLINPLLVLYLYCLPATLTVITIGVVNVLGHGHGYRNYDTEDSSTNSWIASIITLGEGWHNNHHAKPNQYYVGEKWYELDIMGLIIKLIRV
jgi:stearoyl-CoA desaturase (delta-9 desaturase)